MQQIIRDLYEFRIVMRVCVFVLERKGDAMQVRGP